MNKTVKSNRIQRVAIKNDGVKCRRSDLGASSSDDISKT